MALKYLWFSTLCEDLVFWFQCHSWTTCFPQHLWRGLDRTLPPVTFVGGWKVLALYSLREKLNSRVGGKKNSLMYAAWSKMASPWGTTNQLYFQSVGIPAALYCSQVWGGEHFKGRNFITDKKIWLFFSLDIGEVSCTTSSHWWGGLRVPIPGPLPVFLRSTLVLLL